MLSAPVVLNALTTFAPFAHRATSSAAEVVWPMARPAITFPPRATGFVQSTRILPLSFPAAPIALLAASQGVVSAITSPKAAASAILPALARAPHSATSALTFLSAGARAELDFMATGGPALAQRSTYIPCSDDSDFHKVLSFLFRHLNPRRGFDKKAQKSQLVRKINMAQRSNRSSPRCASGAQRTRPVPAEQPCDARGRVSTGLRCIAAGRKRHPARFAAVRIGRVRGSCLRLF